MGCDIHICTEINKKGVWVNSDDWKYNPYYEVVNTDGVQEYTLNSIYNTRNYNLFALLAGVRNYSNVTPIAEPKGIPEDVHHITKQEYDMWGLDAHTPSWFTLEEIKQAKTDNPTTLYSGMVSPDELKVIENGNMPRTWCQETTIPDYTYVEWTHRNTEFDELITQLELIKRDAFWLYGDEEHTDLDSKVRIVFWFDN